MQNEQIGCIRSAYETLPKITIALLGKGFARIRMSRAKINVQFRLDPELFEKLEQQARAASVAPGIFARQLVVGALGATEDEEPVGALLQTQSRLLVELRRDVRVSVETLLIAAGRMKPPDAHEWVSQNLPPD